MRRLLHVLLAVVALSKFVQQSFSCGPGYVVGHFGNLEPSLKQFFLPNDVYIVYKIKHIMEYRICFYIHFFITTQKNIQFEFTIIKFECLFHFYNSFEDCLDYFSLFKVHEYNLRRSSRVL